MMGGLHRTALVIGQVPEIIHFNVLLLSLPGPLYFNML